MNELDMMEYSLGVILSSVEEQFGGSTADRFKDQLYSILEEDDYGLLESY